MVNVHGMVSRLVEPVEYAHALAALRSSREYGKGKSFLVNYLRAAVREDESSRSDLGNCSGIQSLICPEGILQSSAMLGKSVIVLEYQVNGN